MIFAPYFDRIPIHGISAVIRALGRDPVCCPVRAGLERMGNAKGVGRRVVCRSSYSLALSKDGPVSRLETMDALCRVNDRTEGTQLPRVPEAELEGILRRDRFALLGLEDGDRRMREQSRSQQPRCLSRRT